MRRALPYWSLPSGEGTYFFFRVTMPPRPFPFFSPLPLCFVAMFVSWTAITLASVGILIGNSGGTVQ
jgi:hypothetical protein